MTDIDVTIHMPTTVKPVKKPATPWLAKLRTVVLRVFTWTVLGSFAVAIIYPLVWMVLSGFKSNSELFSDTWGLPDQWQWQNYAQALNLGVFRYFLNSVLVTGLSIVGVVLVSALAAYGLTRIRFPGATPITLMLLGGLMLSPTVAMVPVVQLLQTLNLYDTYAGLILLYIAYRIPFTLFLIRAYMITLPREVEESAMIDGASRLRIFRSIVLPLSRPILVSAAILQMIYAWNEFPFALVAVNDPLLKTLPVGLLNLKSAVTTDWPVLFAALTLAAIPLMIAFLIGQRQFIRGLAEGFGK
ncbi:carbohydrate ABC transporter permease [Arthrobacter pigmenti]